MLDDVHVDGDVRCDLGESCEIEHPLVGVDPAGEEAHDTTTFRTGS